MTLHALRGHEEVRRVLADAAARGALPSSLLLHGPRGVGKQHLALWLARLLVCKSPAEGPCETCGPCRMARSLEHPDIHWYFPLERPKRVSGDRLADALEEARMEALADARAGSFRASYSTQLRGIYLGAVKNIRARAHRRPTMAEGPVFVIGDAELLVPQESSQEAANALLKLLEEPPGGGRFVLTSSEPGLLLPTIRSRTVPLQVGGLPDDVVAALLVEQCGIDPEEAAWAATVARGSPGRALAFLPVNGEPSPLETLRIRALDLVVAATAGAPSAGYKLALEFDAFGARTLFDLFAFVEELLRDVAAVAAGAPERVLHRDRLDRLTKVVDRTSVAAADVPLAFAVIEKARELARTNVNPQLIVTGLIADIRAALASGLASGRAAGRAVGAGTA